MAAVLASCRSLGGSVRVESTPGGGTCIRFTIPVVESRPAA
jgi:signal transduction histidine kinase